MEDLRYVDRKNTNSIKWDAQTAMFQEEGLHAMWVADMDFRVPQCVTDALHKYVEDGIIGYYKIPESYYQSFINWEKDRHGVSISKDWIRFAPGIISAFNWLIQLTTSPGDHVIVMTPVYYPFLDAVKNNDRILINSDLINNHGEYSIDFDDFESKIIKNNVKTFIFCSPHNPVSRVWKKDELQRIFEICTKHNVFVISDEIHQDLVFGENEHISSLLVQENKKLLVSLMSASKTFNLAGSQNSFVVIPDDNLRKEWDEYVMKIRVLNGNAFGYIAAESALTNGVPWLESLKNQVISNHEYLVKRLKKELPQVIVTPLEGTYLTWIDLSAYTEDHCIKDIMQNKCKLAVDYGSWFGKDYYENFIRINLATSLENVEIGASRLIDVLKNLNN